MVWVITYKTNIKHWVHLSLTRWIYNIGIQADVPSGNMGGFSHPMRNIFLLKLTNIFLRNMIWKKYGTHVAFFALTHLLLGYVLSTKKVWINKVMFTSFFSAAKSLFDPPTQNDKLPRSPQAKFSRHFRADRVVAAQPFLGFWKAVDMWENHGNLRPWFKGN